MQGWKDIAITAEILLELVYEMMSTSCLKVGKEFVSPAIWYDHP